MIQKILSDQFIKNNAVLFVGSMITAVLNYAYHPVMSRLLSVEDFGQMQALISLTYIIGIFLAVYGTVSVNIIANHGKMEGEKRVLDIFSFTTPFVFVLMIGIFIASPFLKQFLHLTSFTLFIPLVIILCTEVVSTYYSAYIRGIKNFYILSIASIISSGGRLVFGVILVLLGMKVFGALFALALATLMMLLYMQYKLRGIFKITYIRGKSVLKTVKSEFRYTMLVLSSMGFVIFLYSSDIIFAKLFFPSELAGAYSGISIIARSIFFATGSVTAVLLPSVILKESRSKNRKILLKAFLINAVICILAMGTFLSLPNFTIKLLLGEQYMQLRHLLAYAGVSAIFISIVNVLYTYYLALRDRRLIYSSVGGMIVLILLMIINHQALDSIITNYLITSFFVLSILGIFKFVKNDKGRELR